MNRYNAERWDCKAATNGQVWPCAVAERHPARGEGGSKTFSLCPPGPIPYLYSQHAEMDRGGLPAGLGSGAIGSEDATTIGVDVCR
jgi:hypothetical protein